MPLKSAFLTSCSTSASTRPNLTPSCLVLLVVVAMPLGTLGNSWLTHSVPRRLQPSQVTLTLTCCGGAKVHLTFRRLHSQQL
jgi:hypothetical protein